MKKKLLIIIFVFTTILINNIFIQPLGLDEIWNYGFSYAIRLGEIPYKDFNMVLTPLYSFIMAIPLIFKNNILVFHIFHAFLFSCGFYFVYKLINDKAWLLMILFFIPISITYSSYNIFLFVLFVVLIYLEKNNRSDYLIGFILGCMILTKQSVGIMVLIPGILYYIKDKNKVLKRLLGCFIPCLIFLIYLLVTKSFNSFIDLCFFGLFDFANKNGNIFNIYFIFSIILNLLTIFFIIKKPKEIYFYYELFFSSIIIPLYDIYHFQLQLIAFTFICFMYIKKVPLKSFYMFLTVFVCILSLFIKDGSSRKIIYPNKINHFEYRLLISENLKFTEEVNNYLKENKDNKYMFLDSSGYYFRIINDEKVSYLDLINMGNWGYNGSNKLLATIKSLPKNTLFIIDDSELIGQKQVDRNALRYVIKHGRKIKTIKIYDIYVIDK